MKRKYLYWIIIIVYLCFIYGNSLVGGTTSTSISNVPTNFVFTFFNDINISIDFNLLSLIIRKIAHVIEYLILGILLFLAISNKPLIKNKKINFIILAICLPVIDETIQYFVPGRSSQISDVCLDFISILLGYFICSRIKTNKQ